MKTSKPISTISYNTDTFLKNKIKEWRENGIIEFGMWILHQPDEDNKKAHYHVYLKPAKLIQTVHLEDDSLEIDPNWKSKDSYKDEAEKEEHEKKQFLKMISFRVSKESDWLLYAIHDENYLFEKGMSRNISYTLQDIQSTCDDTLKDIISHIGDEQKGKLEYRIIQCIEMGMNWQDICRSGFIPLRSISMAKIYYTAITGQERLT